MDPTLVPTLYEQSWSQSGLAIPDILSSAGDFTSLLILESLLIQNYEPLLSVHSKSDPIYLFSCLFNSVSLLLASS